MWMSEVLNSGKGHGTTGIETYCTIVCVFGGPSLEFSFVKSHIGRIMKT